jgi:hypothetical protein
MLAAGEALKVASDRRGNANVAITADLYAHTLASMDRDAATAAPNVIEGRSGSAR